MKTPLKSEIKTLLYIFLNLLSRIFPSRGASILMYHSVGYDKIFFNVKPEEFKKQMAWLHRQKYNVISLDRLAIILENKEKIPAKTVVLTFDDGFEDNFLNAFPVLKQYGFPATIFLATNFIGGIKASETTGLTQPILSWLQIKEMHQSGFINFQPHGHLHLKLAKIGIIEAEKEILGSKKIIEENLGKSCRLFSYPKGSYNEKIKEIFKKNGFKAAVTTKIGWIENGDDLLELKRNSVDSMTSFWQFRGKVDSSAKLFELLFARHE